MVVLGPTVFDTGSDFQTGYPTYLIFILVLQKVVKELAGALRSNVLHK